MKMDMLVDFNKIPVELIRSKMLHTECGHTLEDLIREVTNYINNNKSFSNNRVRKHMLYSIVCSVVGIEASYETMEILRFACNVNRKNYSVCPNIDRIKLDELLQLFGRITNGIGLDDRLKSAVRNYEGGIYWEVTKRKLADAMENEEIVKYICEEYPSVSPMNFVFRGKLIKSTDMNTNHIVNICQAFAWNFEASGDLDYVLGNRDSMNLGTRLARNENNGSDLIRYMGLIGICNEDQFDLIKSDWNHVRDDMFKGLAHVGVKDPKVYYKILKGLEFRGIISEMERKLSEVYVFENWGDLAAISGSIVGKNGKARVHARTRARIKKIMDCQEVVEVAEEIPAESAETPVAETPVAETPVAENPVHEVTRTYSNSESSFIKEYKEAIQNLVEELFDGQVYLSSTATVEFMESFVKDMINISKSMKCFIAGAVLTENKYSPKVNEKIMDLVDVINL